MIVFLYHDQNFTLRYAQDCGATAADENELQAALEGEKKIRAVVTSSRQTPPEEPAELQGVAVLTRKKALRKGDHQTYMIPAETVNKIYNLSEQVEYILPYQAAAAAYVEHKLKEAQIFTQQSTAVFLADAQGPHVFFTIVRDDSVELFRSVGAGDLHSEFLRTANYYTQTHPESSLYLMSNHADCAAECMGALEGLGGPDIVAEKSPALWAAYHLTVTPQFLLPEVELRRERETRRKQWAAKTTGAGILAAVAAALFSYSAAGYYSARSEAKTLKRNISRLDKEIEFEIPRRFGSLVQRIQPDWRRVLLEIAQSSPQYSKIVELAIVDQSPEITPETRKRSYTLTAQILPADPDPKAAQQAARLTQARLKNTQYLKGANVNLGRNAKGDLLLLITATLEAKGG